MSTTGVSFNNMGCALLLFGQYFEGRNWINLWWNDGRIYGRSAGNLTVSIESIDDGVMERYVTDPQVLLTVVIESIDDGMMERYTTDLQVFLTVVVESIDNRKDGTICAICQVGKVASDSIWWNFEAICGVGFARWASRSEFNMIWLSRRDDENNTARASQNSDMLRSSVGDNDLVIGNETILIGIWQPSICCALSEPARVRTRWTSTRCVC